MSEKTYTEFRNEDGSWNREKLGKHLERRHGWRYSGHVDWFIADVEEGRDPYAHKHEQINPDPVAHLNFAQPLSGISWRPY